MIRRAGSNLWSEKIFAVPTTFCSRINGSKRSTFLGCILVSRSRQISMEQFPKKEIETLWAPWRVEYFEKEPRDMEFLMAAARASDDSAHLVITRRKTAFLM